MTNEKVGARKSLYVFLASMLGSLLFLMLHRLIVFGYTILLGSSYETYGFGLSLVEWMALEYITLILSLLLGAWYGVWLGLYWYKAVYEDSFHGGFVDHLICNYWPVKSHSTKLKGKIESVVQKLEADTEKLEALTGSLPEALSSKKPTLKRRVVRRRVTKKIAV